MFYKPFLTLNDISVTMYTRHHYPIAYAFKAYEQKLSVITLYFAIIPVPQYGT